MGFSMKNILTVVVSLGVLYAAGDLRAEEEPQQTAPKAVAYYGWLDKFENPSHRPPTPTQKHDAHTLPEKGQAEQTEQHEIASVKTPPSAESGSVAVSDVVVEEETAAPGEGLGCYYHRAYYSHLPMFKDDVYSLRGSFDVAETFHKPSEDVISVPPDQEAQAE
jgi:hypothetical protein